MSCPWTANSWEGFEVAWRLASRPLTSSVQMGEVRLRLTATHSTPAPLPPPLPNFPFQLRAGWRLQRKGKEEEKQKSMTAPVFTPSLCPQPNQIEQEASETEEGCLLIFAWAPSPPALFPFVYFLLTSFEFSDIFSVFVSYVMPSWTSECCWGYVSFSIPLSKIKPVGNYKPTWHLL